MTPLSFLDLRAMHEEVEADLQQVWSHVLRTSNFIGGPLVETFEQEWAAYCGATHCVGMSDGTAALELTLRALGVGPGAEVIVPAYTFIATAAAVALTGARPVFIDVDPATLLITADGVRAALTPRTRAVIPVHLYGNPVDMDAINQVAAEAGIAVIEDAAQSHGATWQGRRAGSLGRAACFSFYPGKNLGAFGDAGAVVTDDPDLAARIRALGNHGRPPDDPQTHMTVGTTGRLDALQAGILSVKLRRLDGWTAARRRIAAMYRDLLRDLPVDFPVELPGAQSCHHLAVILCDGRDRVRTALAAEGIPTSVHYAIPCHRQQAFRDLGVPELPVAESAARRALSLPMHPHLTEAQVEQVAGAVRRALTAVSRPHQDADRRPEHAVAGR